MKQILSNTCKALATTVLLAGSVQAVEIEVAYPYSHLFDVTFEKMVEQFNAEHPDIKVNFRAVYENYEDANNTILRESVAGDLPDVTMQGLNRQAILVDKGIAKSLEPFIADEADFAKDGYHEAMLNLSKFDDGVYGLPFSISLPVGVYNMDLMKKAGINDLPETWADVSAACGKLKAAGIKNPLFWGWNITGNWFAQALMWTQDKPIVEGNKMNLDSPEALVTLETMKSLFRDCDMANLSFKDAMSSYSAGEVAMLYWSTSALGAFERNKGDFEMKTHEFPGLNGKPMGLPAGGNAAMLVSTSEDPEELKASWTFLKFITSGVGAATVAETTGYMPPNKAANEIILADFYKNNPNKETAVRQLPLLRDWLAYPGDNGLAITQVIYDAIEGIVVGDYDDMTELQEEMSDEVSDLLPK